VGDLTFMNELGAMTDRKLPSPQPNEKPRLVPVGAITLAAIMWVVSLILPVWETRSDQGEWSIVRGLLPAMIGWLGLFIMCPAWFANLLLIRLCFRLLRGQRVTFWLSVVAFAIAASAYMMPALYGDNEEAVIVGRRIGFYLWLGSFLVILLAHAIQVTASERPSARVRWSVVAFMVLGLVGLERTFRVGVSPLEAALKDSDDATALKNALARDPPQAERDAALPWAIRQYVRNDQGGPGLQQIEKLIAAGANVNQVDRHGDTLLMQGLWSCRGRGRGGDSLVTLLLRAGANVNARDRRGKTVLDIAEEIGISRECRTILSNAGALTSRDGGKAAF
jgi:hypothetical protein